MAFMRNSNSTAKGNHFGRAQSGPLRTIQDSNHCRELERLKFDNPGPANIDFDDVKMKANTNKDNGKKSSPVRRRRNQNRAARPTHPPNAFYDDHGRMIVNGEDLCDCLSRDCPGCYYPCPKCSSTRCGTECRVRRRWSVDTIRVNDTNEEIFSPFVELIRLPLAKQQEWRNSKLNNGKKTNST